MEDLLELSVLYEYYGSLLTQRQFEICDMYLIQNLSLGEISENLGITRQGVRDALIKSENILKNFEAKLGIMKKNEILSSLVASVQNLSDNSSASAEVKLEINKLTQQINNLL